MKKFAVCFIFFLISSFLFCNEKNATSVENVESIKNIEASASNEANTKKSLFGETFYKPANFSSFINQFDFVLKFGPSLYLNTQSTLVSAPSPILYPISIGVNWPNYTFLSVQPTVSFFIMYSLWHKDMALPAEIENRTATSYCVFLNIPATLAFYLEKSRIQFSLGAGFLFPITTISTGVAGTDSGFSGSAQSDVEKIKQYYFSNARFLFATVEFSWLFNINKNLKVGPFASAYLPIGSFINNEGFSRAMFNLGIKFSL